jgi:ArsR family transcriptional regulator
MSSMRKALQITILRPSPYCVLSFEAVAQLRKMGFKARRLEDGLPEWKAAGLPVESSNPY